MRLRIVVDETGQPSSRQNALSSWAGISREVFGYKAARHTVLLLQQENPHGLIGSDVRSLADIDVGLLNLGPHPLP